jgi:hypothetical protein
MGWNYYGLDREAQQLVLTAKKRDDDSLNQAFKMRESVAYGLERFWGEHLRLHGKEQTKSESKYWKETWDVLVKVMKDAKVNIPNDRVNNNDTQAVEAMANKLWQLDIQDQRIATAVLTQLCDCVVWWTQRYK